MKWVQQVLPEHRVYKKNNVTATSAVVLVMKRGYNAHVGVLIELSIDSGETISGTSYNVYPVEILFLFFEV